MKRNIKINRMFQDHNIEQPHFSLVLQLKKTIQELQDKI